MPRPKPPAGQAWEDNHQRITFYCPKDLVVAVEAAMADTSRSKSQVIVDALRAQLLDGAQPIEETVS